MKKRIFDLNEACKMTGIPKKQLLEFIRTDFIPCHIIKNQAIVYFKISELEVWIQEMRKRISGQEGREVEKTGHAATCIFREIENKEK